MDEATTSTTAKSKEKIHASHHSSRFLMIGLLVVVWLAAPGMSRGPDNDGPQNLLCYKSCCGALYYCLVNCSWEAGRNADAANYTLHFWYHNEEMGIKSRAFPAGKATFFSFNQDRVYARKNVTIWVESHVVGSPLLASENLTLQIDKAYKFDPPSRNSIKISRLNNILSLTWPKPKDCHHSMKKEARIKPRNDVEWTLRNCTSDDRAMEKLIVTCHVGKNIPYEAQIRFRTSDWSSHWSDWSESVFVPAEILESPKVEYTIGDFGKNGLRNVTLEWEKPNAEQGDVNYSLTFVLLPCSCEDANSSIPISHQTSYQTALSSAGYDIFLEVSNEAGVSPAHSLRLPPAQDVDTRFLNVSLSGRNFTLTWEAKMDADVYCFEKQPLGKVLSPAPCDTENLSAREHYESTGTVEFNMCYRLAVHGFNWDMDIWSTFGFTYLFARNTSLEDPIRINVTNQKPDSAVIWWEPPKALSACPGMLKKYIICCQHEQDRNITYYEVNASETHYTILNLQPNTTYRVGVWAYTTGSKGICKALVPFITRSSPPDSKMMTLALSFLYLFGGILAATCIFHFGKKRVKKMLCPALPNPANTEALKIFTRAETVQVRPEQGLLKLLESSSLTEPFTVEVLSVKEEQTAMTMVDSLDFMKAVEEPLLPKETRVGSGNVLPSEYKGQGLLSPLEDDCHGREGFGEFAGISPEMGTGCSLLFPDAIEAGDSQDLPLPLAPLSFRLLNKLVVIKNGDSSCDFPCSDGVSI